MMVLHSVDLLIEIILCPRQGDDIDPNQGADRP
jgi:hypothetical protein